MNKADWENNEPLGIRTKIALKILFVMVKILSPYEFGSKFEKEFDAIAKDIYEVKS